MSHGATVGLAAAAGLRGAPRFRPGCTSGLPAGSAESRLYGRNVGDASELSALTSRLHDEGDGFVVALDEEGGDVTRTEVARRVRRTPAMAPWVRRTTRR